MDVWDEYLFNLVGEVLEEDDAREIRDQVRSRMDGQAAEARQDRDELRRRLAEANARTEREQYLLRQKQVSLDEQVADLKATVNRLDGAAKKFDMAPMSSAVERAERLQTQARETIRERSTVEREIARKIDDLTTRREHQSLAASVGIPTSQSLANDILCLRGDINSGMTQNRESVNHIQQKLDKLDIAVSSHTRRVNDLCARRLEEILAQTKISTSVREAKTAMMTKMESLASAGEMRQGFQTVESQAATMEKTLLAGLNLLPKTVEVQRALLSHGEKVASALTVGVMSVKDEVDRRNDEVRNHLTRVRDDLKVWFQTGQQVAIKDTAIKLGGIAQFHQETLHAGRQAFGELRQDQQQMRQTLDRVVDDFKEFHQEQHNASSVAIDTASRAIDELSGNHREALDMVKRALAKAQSSTGEAQATMNNGLASIERSQKDLQSTVNQAMANFQRGYSVTQDNVMQVAADLRQKYQKGQEDAFKHHREVLDGVTGIADTEKFRTALRSEIQKLAEPLGRVVSGLVADKWSALERSEIERQRTIVASHEVAAAHNEHVMRAKQSEVEGLKVRLHQVIDESREKQHQLVDKQRQDAGIIQDLKGSVESLNVQLRATQEANSALQDELKHAKESEVTQDACIVALRDQLAGCGLYKNQLEQCQKDLVTLEQQRDDALARYQSVQRPPNPTPANNAGVEIGELSKLFSQFSKELEGISLLQEPENLNVSETAVLLIPVLRRFGIKQASSNIKAFIDSAPEHERFCLNQVAEMGADALPRIRYTCDRFHHWECIWVSIFEERGQRFLDFR